MKFPNHLKAIHMKALQASGTYKTAEADLLDIISQVRHFKVYRYLECSSLFEYCTKILKLDPGVVYAFTTVAKKITEVPELHEKIKSGSLNVSTARRITPVLTSANKNEWFDKAETLTMRKLEKEVAICNPKLEVKDRASYLNSKRVKLEMGLSEFTMLDFRRAQDLVSKRLRRPASMEEVMVAVLKPFLRTTDPIEKAKRAKIRGSRQKSNPATWQKFDSSESIPAAAAKEGQAGQTNQIPSEISTAMPTKTKGKSPRTPTAAAITHEVNLRDQDRCRYINSQNQRCSNKRFTEIHHIKPVSQGGENTIENLITLCSEHHKSVHLQL